jgi:hypothetical protein
MCEKSPASIGGEMKAPLVRPSCIDTLRICDIISANKGGLIFERTWIAIIIRRRASITHLIAHYIARGTHGDSLVKHPAVRGVPKKHPTQSLWR